MNGGETWMLPEWCGAEVFHSKIGQACRSHKDGLGRWYEGVLLVGTVFQ